MQYLTIKDGFIYYRLAISVAKKLASLLANLTCSVLGLGLESSPFELDIAIKGRQ